MKILLLGSGALQIGQAGEFDYSGSQAIKALKEEGHKVILINPNIATIQTSQGFADKVYFLPITPHFIEEVIKKERPQGIILSFGGQTALNCGLELVKTGTLSKYKVKVLGTPTAAIEKTEDRYLFVKTLEEIGAKYPKSIAAKSGKEAQNAAQKIGYPVMVRGGFSLGGQDSGIAKNKKELLEIASRALAKTKQILIEEYLNHWKEIEYEVVRDKFDNCITVCNMENFDPMGIHTGESIVVAPSQTLNNFEYHGLREVAIKVIRHLKIIGECNIQFALNPSPALRGESAKNSPLEPSMDNSEEAKDKNWRTSIIQPLDYRIIEVNARLSRSSALASKATGYPLAYVAAKLALGYSLIDIKNSITKKTIAAFEPALDYLVVKIPRWDLAKFKNSHIQIGSSMQSVGEVMAIGRKFEEALQKATRMLDIGAEGILDENFGTRDFKIPTPARLFSIAKAIKRGVGTEKISQKTGIDLFFLEKIKNICDLEKELKKGKLEKEILLAAKQYGISDKRIAKIKSTTPAEIKKLRNIWSIKPVVKQIDTLAAEYPAETNYLYLTYNGDKNDIEPESGKKSGVAQQEGILTTRRSTKNHSSTYNLDIDRALAGIKKVVTGPQTAKVIVLGSGPYRIGSSVEFDWCSVTCAQTANANGIKPIIINCNPETVSTDYDMAERLYFEELTEETVLEIYEKESPFGVIVSMGGQTPNNLAPKLAASGLKILGTSVQSIDNAEDRNKFSALCDELSIDQPQWAMLKDTKSAATFAKKIGFPVLVRPSYVLSGAAMNVAFTKNDLEQYLKAAANVSQEHPVVISKFHENAKELEIDAVAKNGEILCFAISEHIENAGVHSGDSTIVLPTQNLYPQTITKVKDITLKIAKSLDITGPFNIQFLAVKNHIRVIECNLRASRSLPFVSKVTGINFAKVATEAILRKGGKPAHHSFSEGRETTDRPRNYIAVKAPQFSFARIKGADPVLRVEMASTGEVATFGHDIYEAFLKSLLATGNHLPEKSVFISLAGKENKQKFLESAKILQSINLKIYATEGTSKFLNSNGVKAKKLYKIHEHKKPNVLDILHAKKVDLVINIFDPYFKKEFDDDYLIRRTTIDFGIPLLTNMQIAQLFAKAISLKKLKDLKALSWDKYVNFSN
ncbi:MAG: Carbamoyl-phosphate synthase / aspartate carbamoyltransferase / dihydroorotase [Candidatus Curtissbacteria bacterium GW2011_GWA1_40_9]|uniref:Carbamoyl phosphate synthase pyrimidine-specific large chain n=1 Tax=Candidatus Curtissbacteria bacterium GW2011_GWA1_40_9 TaxID=1618408 RepID=A0A0G0WSB0_9BACT|nr:MAG: Carbamoyl-phosphate synthase / aspartate carbamoyltransferase / dihydroorotase [Candidatus Curtissbacteria bacterium GW2011_GWA1_40_9]